MSRRLRTMSTARLLAFVAAAVVVAASAAAIAVAASRDTGTPPPKPTAQAIHDALAGSPVGGATARVTFTNNLFPTSGLLGNLGSALMSGATGRLWVTNDGRGRIELQADAGDTQIVWSPTRITAYDASSNTAYEYDFPKRAGTAHTATNGAPTIDEITTFLTKLGAHLTLSDAQPTNVANRPAYSVSVSPKGNGGLLSSVELAWDADHAVPLRIGIYAKGEGSPVLQLEATDISYGTVSDSDVDIAPPAGAKIVDLGGLGQHAAGSGGGTTVSGLAAVQAAAPFPVAAPDTLGGLDRTTVKLVGGDTIVAVYGHGLGSILLSERKSDGAAAPSSMLGTMPTVGVNGATAHELATPLGTALEWQAGGVAYTLAGSVTQAAAEAAAKQLP